MSEHDAPTPAQEIERELAAHRSDPACPGPSTHDPASAAFAIDAARSLRDDRCDDVLVLDVRELSQVTNYIVIATGTSDVQMRAALNHVEALAAGRGLTSFGSSKDDRATWLLADFIDVVVHLFEPNTRAHYDLEMMWGDAKRVPLPDRTPPGPNRQASGS